VRADGKYRHEVLTPAVLQFRRVSVVMHAGARHRGVPLVARLLQLHLLH
jgi:hypothetical protein